MDNLNQSRGKGLKAVDSIILILMPQNVDDFVSINEKNFVGHHTLIAILKIGVRGRNERKVKAQL